MLITYLMHVECLYIKIYHHRMIKKNGVSPAPIEGLFHIPQKMSCLCISFTQRNLLVDIAPTKNSD